jgi:phage tail sheath protein FI
VRSLQTPGVYYERVDASAPAISALRTDIAGFVGIATRGPLHQALPVQSWRQFQAYFGDFTGAGYLAYAVRAFFENGGQRCWIVRVASEMAATAGITLRIGGDDCWRITASSPGVWGNDLGFAIRETHRFQTLTDPCLSSPEASVVASVTGFTRGVHVKLSQDKAAPVYRVVSEADAVTKRLIFDSVVSGFDPNQPILIESIEYTIWVREQGRLIRVYEGLSLVPINPRYGPCVLPRVIERESGATRDLPAAPEPIMIEESRVDGGPALKSICNDLQFRERVAKKWESMQLKPLTISADQVFALRGGEDGLASLSVCDFIGAEVDPLDSDEMKARKTRGLRALEEVSEVSIVAIPDINIQPSPAAHHNPPPPCIPDPCLPPGPPPPATPRAPSVGDLPPVFSEAEIYQAQAALIAQCEKLRNRIALLDPPFAAARDDKVGVGAARAWRSRFDSKYAAFYYPWLRVVDPLRSPASLTRDIPPSGHVAGQYAQTDFQFGVHKAPANAPLVWAQDVTVAVDDATHGVLNPLGINAIRPLAGRGIRIFGARTVSSDPDWRYVNVRRLIMMIEKAIDVATQWAVFEPNNTVTRAKLHLALTSFLLTLWQRGALMGAAADEAFFVKCDEGNNPPNEREQGRMLAVVGVAPSRPFEFIILRVGRVHNEFEITEAKPA